MSQQQPCLCRPQQRERRKDEQGERERLGKPKRWMETEGAEERDRWRKTEAGGRLLSALLGESWAHFFLAPVLVLLRSQAAAVWWDVNVKVLPGIVSLLVLPVPIIALKLFSHSRHITNDGNCGPQLLIPSGNGFTFQLKNKEICILTRKTPSELGFFFILC